MRLKAIDLDEKTSWMEFDEENEEWIDKEGTIEEYLGWLNKLTAVDAVPVVHGRWDDTLDGITPYCSICHRSHNCLNRTPDYCPHCGAKMDLKED